MPDLESHWLAERLAYLGRVLTGDSVWRRKASRTFPKALRNLLGSSELSWPRKELYWELVVGSASDPLSERHGWTPSFRSPGDLHGMRCLFAT